MHLSTHVCLPLPDQPIPESSSEVLPLWAQSVGQQARSLTGFLATLQLPASVTLPALPRAPGPALTTLSPLGDTESHSPQGQPRPEVLWEPRGGSLDLFLFKGDNS